ncbi:MAG: addiction module protein [bacterium]|nr:addiction module protein [bacterium]
MTVEEKLRTMEMLWDDICRNVPEFPSPTWHQQLLREREQRIEEGKEQFVNWEQAKREIWDAVS